MAYFLPDIPEEIIHASGVYPFPLLDIKRRSSLSEGVVPTFLCPLVRNPLEMALAGELDFVDGMVIPYTCDTTRAFSHVWEDLFPSLFNHTLWFPKKGGNNASRTFLCSEFLRFKERVEEFSNGRISDDALSRSIHTYNRSRKILRELFHRRGNGGSCLAYSDFMEILKRSMFMPGEENTRGLVELVDDLEKSTANTGESVRVFLFGAICDSYDLLKCMEGMGLQIVDDNLYNGTRYFLGDVNEDEDPIEALVERHFAKDPLSVYHYPEEEWIDYFEKRVKENNIQGFIFLLPKYCDPAQFDYPFIKKLLNDWGIPVLHLETDFPSFADAGLHTRLEAFTEMVKG